MQGADVVWKIITRGSDAAVAAGVAGALAGWGAYEWVAAQTNYYDAPLICGASAVGVPVALAGGAYAARRGVRAASHADWPAVWARLRGNDPVPAAPAAFDWYTAVTETYRPGRRKWDLPVGLDEHERLVASSMRHRNAHLVVNGPTGSGKSVFVNQMIIAAAMSGLYQVVVVCRTDKDYRVVRPMKNVHVLAYADPDQSIVENKRRYAATLPRVVESLNDEVGRRQDLLARREARQMSGVRADQRPPNILLVLEEFSNAALLMDREGRKEFFEQVLIAVQEARAAAINLLILTQRADAGSVSTDIRANTASVTFRVRDRTEAYVGTGVKGSGAETLRQVDADRGAPGECIFAAAEAVYRLTIPFTDDETLRRAARRHEEETRFRGEPTWLPDYERLTGRLTGGNNTPLTDRVNTPGSGSIPDPRPPLGRNRERVNSVNGDPAAPPPAATPAPAAASAARPRIRPLTPAIIARAAAHYFTADAAFAPFRDSSSYSVEKAQAVFLCLAGGMDKSPTSQLIFGNRGPYYKFVMACAECLERLRRDWVRVQRRRAAAR